MTRNRQIVREVLVVRVPWWRHPRVLLTGALIVVAVAVLWGAVFRSELAAVQLPAPSPPAQAGSQAFGFQPVQPAPAESTTTTAPPEPSEPPAAPEPAQGESPGRPAGAYDEPEQAAQAWYAHRGDIPAEQVQVLQLDRHDHDTFTALVTAEKGQRQHGALLEVVRDGGSYWKVSRLLLEG